MNKRKGHKSGKMPKTSATKLSNKHLNKLAKQGKLKKHLGKSKYVQLLQEKTGKKKKIEQQEQVCTNVLGNILMTNIDIYLYSTHICRKRMQNPKKRNTTFPWRKLIMNTFSDLGEITASLQRLHRSG